MSITLDFCTLKIEYWRFEWYDSIYCMEEKIIWKRY
nr:MAG TPA: periplasmic lypoprotein [Caudoviricetes sp.]